MLFVNLLHKCGNLLVRLYNAEAKRLHKRALTEASNAHKLTLSSHAHTNMAAKVAAKAQQLDNLLNQPQDTKGDSL